MSNKNKKDDEKSGELDPSASSREASRAGENKDVSLGDVETSKGDKKGSEDDSINISKTKVVLIKKLLLNISENSEKLSKLLAGFVTEEDEARISISQASDEAFGDESEDSGEGKIIEGVFDGENMIGPDGKQYSVPANYASKSKLIEGDILKLTITVKGTFVYKQISPIDRKRIIGELEKVSDGSFYVVSEGRRWRVLSASVTYFKGESGDETVILVPKSGDSQWAAVENIVRNAR